MIFLSWKQNERKKERKAIKAFSLPLLASNCTKSAANPRRGKEGERLRFNLIAGLLHPKEAPGPLATQLNAQTPLGPQNHVLSAPALLSPYEQLTTSSRLGLILGHWISGM